MLNYTKLHHKSHIHPTKPNTHPCSRLPSSGPGRDMRCRVRHVEGSPMSQRGGPVAHLRHLGDGKERSVGAKTRDAGGACRRREGDSLTEGEMGVSFQEGCARETVGEIQCAVVHRSGLESALSRWTTPRRACMPCFHLRPRAAWTSLYRSCRQGLIVSRTSWGVSAFSGVLPKRRDVLGTVLLHY